MVIPVVFVLVELDKSVINHKGKSCVRYSFEVICVHVFWQCDSLVFAVRICNVMVANGGCVVSQGDLEKDMGSQPPEMMDRERSNSMAQDVVS